MPLGAVKTALLGAAGAGGGSTMEFIAKVVMDGTSTAVSFTSVPQDYRHLRIVMASGQRASSANAGISCQLNGDTSAYSYGWQVLYHLSPGGGAAGSAAVHYFPPQGDMPNSSNASTVMWELGNYSDSSVGTSINWKMAVDQRNSGITGLGASNWETAAAVTQVDLVSSYTSSGYFYEAPTTFALFGIGAV